MAKEKVPADLMGILTGKKPDKPNTDITQPEHSNNTDITRLREYEDKTTVTFSVRLYKKDREKLRDYFQSRGLKLGQGLRMIIKDFMNSQGL